MHQGEEGRKAYEESCRNKCCGGHAGNVDNGDWDVAAPLGKDGLPYGATTPSPVQVADMIKEASGEEGVKKQEIAHLVCRIGIDMTPEVEEAMNALVSLRDTSLSAAQMADMLKEASSEVAKQAAKEVVLAQHVEAHRQTSIRIVFLDGEVCDIPSNGRDLRLAEYNGSLVVMDHGREESVGTVKQCDVAYIPMNQVKMVLRIAK